eukprot:scaffold54996_cov26-Attheya_sp.AAC.1
MFETECTGSHWEAARLLAWAFDPHHTIKRTWCQPAARTGCGSLVHLCSGVSKSMIGLNSCNGDNTCTEGGSASIIIGDNSCNGYVSELICPYFRVVPATDGPPQ